MAYGRPGSTLVEELNRLAFGGTLPPKTEWLDDEGAANKLAGTIVRKFGEKHSNLFTLSPVNEAKKKRWRRVVVVLYSLLFLEPFLQQQTSLQMFYPESSQPFLHCY